MNILPDVIPCLVRQNIFSKNDYFSKKIFFKIKIDKILANILSILKKFLNIKIMLLSKCWLEQYTREGI